MGVNDWKLTANGITCGISGLALEGGGGSSLIAVRDNKEYKGSDAGSRVARLKVGDGEFKASDGPCEDGSKGTEDVQELSWPDAEKPQDLEAIDSVPGQDGHYVALESKGRVYHFSVEGNTVKVLGNPADLPNVSPGDNYESFALVKHSDGIFAVWATRGQDGTPSKIRTAKAELDASESIKIDSESVKEVSFSAPASSFEEGKGEVRHVSDLKIVNDGAVLLSSAQDPNNNDGPFASVVFNAGKFPDGGDLAISEEPTILGKFTTGESRKIEAVVNLSEGRQIWGTDDEGSGGSIMTYQTS
ncbi:esterase-like activity of phytase family protein [Streptomyces sp. NPDC059008]|uniref:esterase-like activity of phytase family protein n=1 Tax=Streptomyces sp. NPDC059008 TaxID=3346693 RepID=UPI0036A1834F